MEQVENLIIASLTELKTIGSESDTTATTTLPPQESKLIFPQYYVGEHKYIVRISEQEARFLFVKQLETHSFYYAVEAPTKQAYQFSNDGQKIKPVMIDSNNRFDNTGQSANIDVCLFVYDEVNKKFQRKHLIEFKFGNPGQEDYSKDLLKLLCDDDGLTNYFVHIEDVEDLLRRDTKRNIESKYSAAIEYIEGKYTKQVKSSLIIFLFNITDGRLIRYCIENNQLKETCNKII
jgi:hypothetical protein